MYDVRTKGSGSFEFKTKTWRLRSKGLSVTLGKLQDVYGVKFTQSEPAKLERESAPYWRKWLQDTEEDRLQAERDAKASAASAPLRSAFAGMIDRLRQENPANAILCDLEALLRVNAQPQAFGHVGSIESVFQPTAPAAPPTVTIATEVKHALQVHLERTGKTAYYHFTRQALQLLTEVCGQLEPHQLQVDHWRTFFSRVKANPSWNAVTQANMVNAAKRFAKRLSQARGTNFGFIHLPEFLIDVPEGGKVKYTTEEVKTALQHATGLQRLQVLLGSNCGMTAADILTLKPGCIQDGHIVWQRCKLARIKEGGKVKDYKSVAVLKHKLWPATLEALTAYDFAATEYALNDGYTKFTRKYHLPPHKALRKTVAQLIEDHYDTDISKHYRGELTGGTHMNNYVERRLGHKAQADLDAALDKIGHVLGCV
jgi:hypothetical protein